MSQLNYPFSGPNLVRAAFAAGLVLLLAACGSRPDPALKLVDAPAQTVGAREVQMFVATTRRPVDDPGIRFGGERSLRPRYAALTISVPPTHATGEISWPSGGMADASRTFAATRFTPIDEGNARSALRAEIQRTGARHVLLFVHGYNTRFDEAAFRFAQIVHDSKAPVTAVLFSWPSWGTLSSYPYDRESAAISRDGLEFVLSQIAQEPSVSQVSVLAHSMGGWLTLEAMRQMAIRNRYIFPKITDVMLAAPDVDVDVAASQGQALRNIKPRPKLTLFVSADDKALSASRLLWGSKDRLGSLDPKEEPYRTRLQNSGVQVFDLTATTGEDSMNHAKFASSPAVVQLIGRRLAGGQKLGGEDTLGEQAGALTQGTVRALGNVVTAPLRLGTPDPLHEGPKTSGITD